MNRISSIIFGLAAVVLISASCTGFLTEEPKTFVSPSEYYNTADEINAATAGCYVKVGTLLENYGFPGAEPLVMYERLTGNVDFTYAGSGNLSLPLQESNSDLELLWSYYYSAIENCNGTIAGIEGTDAVIDGDTVNRDLAEVYFLRAYYYFNLVRLFGPVPYKTTVTTGVNDAALPCDSEEVIYEGIVSDLKASESLFPASDPFAVTNGRAGKGAAKSLLAKVYLTMAGYPLQKNECYKLAYDKALEVVNSGAYSLYATHDEWRKALVKTEKENIFAIQSDKNNATSWLHRMTLPYPATTPAIALGQEYGGIMIPTVNFYNSYDNADARKTAFFYTSYPSKDDAATTVTFTRPFAFKFFDEDAIADGKSGYRLPLIRYADVLLTLAEAACAGGSTTDAQAIAAYTQVRGRAFSGFSATSVSADEVLRERFLEFCYEGQNWYDMIRTRKAYNPGSKAMTDMIGYKAETFTAPFTESDLYAPYPLRETRLNPNLKR